MRKNDKCTNLVESAKLKPEPNLSGTKVYERKKKGAQLDNTNKELDSNIVVSVCWCGYECGMRQGVQVVCFYGGWARKILEKFWKIVWPLKRQRCICLCFVNVYCVCLCNLHLF